MIPTTIPAKKAFRRICFNIVIQGKENIIMLNQEMAIIDFLKDERFNMFFSFVLGLGLICMFRPICSGSECNVLKPPSENDFDKYVYRMGGGKCFEFKTGIVECPASGTIEAFRECMSNEKSYEPFRDQFARRTSSIMRCD